MTIYFYYELNLSVVFDIIYEFDDRFVLMVDGIWMNIEVKRGNMIDGTPFEVGDHCLYIKCWITSSISFS